MSVPDSPIRQSPIQQVNVLRQELKEWEKAFATANGGRKAGRDDIKKDASIAAKYKTYNRLREQSSKGTISSPSRPKSRQQLSEDRSPKKRKRVPLDDIQSSHQFAQIPCQTPQKSRKHNDFSTPNISRFQQQQRESPSTLRKLFSLGHDRSTSPWPFVTHIGPTPQRDGKILGLFDVLSESGGSAKSAARGETGQMGQNGSRSELIAETPSKRRSSNEKKAGGLLDVTIEDAPRARRHSRTPASTGRHFLLSTLYKTPAAFHITPTKQPGQALDPDTSLDAVLDPVRSSTSDTPAFLRRSHNRVPSSAAEVTVMTSFEDIGELSPVAVRMPPKLVGRGLSALVQGLREMEEEAMEDELDALREMEHEELGLPLPKPKAKILVKDSQQNPFVNVATTDLAELEPIVEEDGDEEKGGDGDQPMRKWKKKGQKRTTKRTVMKPRGKLKPAIVLVKSEGSEEVVAEMQTRVASHEDDEYHDSVDELAQGASRPKPKVKKPKGQDGEKAKKPGRKQNPGAHANFRKLNIKNKNLKGKGGGRRFGRR